MPGCARNIATVLTSIRWIAGHAYMVAASFPRRQGVALNPLIDAEAGSNFTTAEMKRLGRSDREEPKVGRIILPKARAEPVPD
jgi:hypothetical protein